MSVYKSFATAAEHVASWKAGGPRYAQVDGWTIDAIQAEKDLKDAAARQALDRRSQSAAAEIAESCPTCGAVRAR